MPPLWYCGGIFFGVTLQLILRHIIFMNRLSFLLLAGIVALMPTSCNSNDDGGPASIEIPGVTIDGDVDCCSAEEALQVYKFLQTVKIIPSLSTVVADKYNVFAYAKNGTFHEGYNEIYFVATKKSNGNYIKNFDVTAITPLMHMAAMNMSHSAPASAGVASFNDNYLAVRRGWVSFPMATSDDDSWTLAYQADVLGATGSIGATELTVSALPDGQKWVQSFKLGDKTYYLSLINPSAWQTGANTISAVLALQGDDRSKPYQQATEPLTIDIEPLMPDMGNHTSPDNTPLTLQADGTYTGTINLTMSGLWRIHLTVRDAAGNIVAGGDTLTDGYSSLYWDVTL